MPISVVCGGCKARFNVSEKFAGKQGACPKCKALIKVPEISQEEVKIHVPEEFAAGGKDAKGRAVLKPIAREETKIKPIEIGAMVGGAVFVLLMCLLGRFFPNSRQPLIIAGLTLISPPLAVAGYSFLREQELEPYRGRELWIRASICGAVYALLWAAYMPLASSGLLTGEMWQWLFVAPIFVGVGALASFATLDLDFGSAALHYCFYLFVTLLLRWVIGLDAIWTIRTI